ncbi:D-alanyl-D-alanine carboxypeptidase [Metabacillus fastidiosus]|uniref:D-alanyl-D-alanine carboxypeptidase n=1 Tax=Metabacillus fastidiosus TaxID=1458 RepID=A0ABU6NS28_9BACI|nr:D-alanyl-D-alanine carboxypeptidase [Metabacillus fastidiosus]MED4399949.1 D-alanyl-D-alanine carboxypeptidase [Metabacillus fastidiosus]MED4452187.1 D-alanyl-D-alanine carboxypeptidase [Metabacillus fastidiosus]MED4462434.1 D-alanyl-D-alanine carboxypeptidase [Metabacillus fastidiosus]
MKKRIFTFFSIILIAITCIIFLNMGEKEAGFREVKENVYRKIDTIEKPSVMLDVEVTGKNAILLDKDTGRILFSKNGEEKIYPASTTKIMTALIALENGNLNDYITVGNEVALKLEGESTAYLIEGQVLTLEELLSGLLLQSGNDAARTIAIHTAKMVGKNENFSNEEALSYFAGLMNKKAAEIGANDTHFVNPSGLHDPNHYTTALDMTLITKEAMKKEQFQQLVSRETYSDEKVTYHNTNRLLKQNDPFYFEGANGIKTGFTTEAGRCLISSVSRDGRNLLSFVFHSTGEGVYSDTIALFNAGLGLN